MTKCDTSFTRPAAGDSSKRIDRAVKPATRGGAEKQPTRFALRCHSYLPLRQPVRGKPTIVIHVTTISVTGCSVMESRWS